VSLKDEIDKIIIRSEKDKRDARDKKSQEYEQRQK
jgi:hypothetical protein